MTKETDELVRYIAENEEDSKTLQEPPAAAYLVLLVGGRVSHAFPLRGEIKLVARLRKHLGNPKFTALGERLERIKERHEQGFLTSLEFLKAILEVARDVVEAERETDPQEERDRAKEALTELFNEARTKNTHIIVERIVTDIDEIVKKVRFPDWQHTAQGERLVQRELRRALLKYKLHTDQELFDKAYGYIRQYY